MTKRSDECQKMGLGCEAERSVCTLANQVMVKIGKEWEPEMVAMIPEGAVLERWNRAGP